VFGEDVEDKQFSELYGGDSVIGGNEKGLLRESVYNNQNCGESCRRRKMLNEIHRYGIPWLFRNRKLLQGSVRAMTRSFGSAASSAGLAILGN
jgi:hypothetical protein